MIRKATSSDISEISAIYEHIHDAEEAGEVTIGWERGVYPVEQTAIDALDRGDLYVYENDGDILATAIINQIQVDTYYEANWDYEATDDEVLVLHTLVVDPSHKQGGIGQEFVAFYENTAREMNCPVLRMDTNARNAIARKLYKKLGYHEADILPIVFNGIPGVNLVHLEKKLW